MTENETKEMLAIHYDFLRKSWKPYPDRKVLDAIRIAISSIEEIQQYQAIGTVNECRNARERKIKKNPIILSEQSAESEGKLYIAKYFKCPTCENTSIYFGGLPNNCHNCGQRLV